MHSSAGVWEYTDNIVLTKVNVYVSALLFRWRLAAVTATCAVTTMRPRKAHGGGYAQRSGRRVLHSGLKLVERQVASWRENLECFFFQYKRKPLSPILVFASPQFFFPSFFTLGRFKCFNIFFLSPIIPDISSRWLGTSKRKRCIVSSIPRIHKY